MSTANELTARRLFDEVFNTGDLSALEELAAPDVQIRYGDGATVSGTDSYRRVFTESHAAFPDEDFTVDDCFAGGDRVVVRWRWEATHQSSGRAVSATGISIYRFHDGRVVEAWMESGSAQNAQLG